MKVTEQLFAFPVIEYDSYDINKAMLKEKEEYGEKQSVEYAVGTAKIPATEVKGWFDAFTRDKTIQDINDNGFNCTLILTATLGDYLCAWKRDKFEDKFETHLDKLTKFLDSLDLPEINSD